MKKIIFVFFINFFLLNPVSSNNKIINLSEGNAKAKIEIIVFESLTCSHCATFHKEIYPKLKKDFIDKQIVKIVFKSFPLDLAALNASKIAHCKNDGSPELLHFLYQKQSEWVKGENIEDFNKNLKDILKEYNAKIDFDKCLSDKFIEEHILEERIEGATKYKVNATPTIIINEKKFDKPLTYKNLKKILEKLI